MVVVGLHFFSGGTRTLGTESKREALLEVFTEFNLRTTGVLVFHGLQDVLHQQCYLRSLARHKTWRPEKSPR